MVNYACGFNQSETGKHFECLIIHIISCRIFSAQYPKRYCTRFCCALFEANTLRNTALLTPHRYPRVPFKSPTGPHYAWNGWTNRDDKNFLIPPSNINPFVKLWIFLFKSFGPFGSNTFFPQKGVACYPPPYSQSRSSIALADVDQ